MSWRRLRRRTRSLYRVATRSPYPLKGRVFLGSSVPISFSSLCGHGCVSAGSTFDDHANWLGDRSFQNVEGFSAVNSKPAIDLMLLNPYFQGTTRRIGA